MEVNKAKRQRCLDEREQRWKKSRYEDGQDESGAISLLSDDEEDPVVYTGKVVDFSNSDAVRKFIDDDSVAEKVPDDPSPARMDRFLLDLSMALDEYEQLDEYAYLNSDSSPISDPESFSGVDVRGKLNIIRVLLNCCLHSAAYNDQIQYMAAFLNWFPKVDEGAWADGKTALHVASQYGKNDNCFKLLLESRANPRVSDNHNNTPLHMACSNTDHRLSLEFVELLCQKNCGADVYQMNSNGQTPLCLAVRNENHDVTEYLWVTACLHQTPEGIWTILTKHPTLIDDFFLHKRSDTSVDNTFLRVQEAMSGPHL